MEQILKAIANRYLGDRKNEILATVAYSILIACFKSSLANLSFLRSWQVRLDLFQCNKHLSHVRNVVGPSRPEPGRVRPGRAGHAAALASTGSSLPCQ